MLTYYNRASNKSLRYGDAIEITVEIKGISSEKLSQELGLKTLKSRRLPRKICLFYKLVKEKSPAYLFQLIPENNTPYTTRSVQKYQIPFFKTETIFFKVLSFLQL